MSTSASPDLSTTSAPRSSILALGHAVGAIWALLVGIALLMLGTGLQGSLLGLRASIEGFSTTTVGIVMSSYYLGYLLGSLRAPRLVSAVGHIRVFAAFASIASSTVLLHSLVVEPLGWTLIRIVSGFCMAGLFVVAESWLNEGATNETRGSLLSIYMVVVYGGMGAGQLLLNVADPGGFELFIITSVLVSVALVPAALSVRSAPVIPTPTDVDLREVFHAAPLGVIGSVLAGTASGALFGVGVVYAQLAGLSLAKTSVFMLAAILGGAALQWPVGMASDRVDRRLVIVVVALAAAGACLAGAMGPHGVALLVVVGALGALSMPLYPLCNAHANDYIDADRRVGAGSRLVLANGLGAIAGPFLASWSMDAVGEAGFFWFLAALHVLIAAYAAYRITRRSAAADPAHYHPYPARSSVVVSTLDPEAWDEEDHPRFDTEQVPVVSVDD
ncbi:MFS transporter [Actinomarinicola tropica]|uniref:MFS transporter n=1 Tax=Actinomarinicola tropica TaxID=2789776 RepID=A0A5Q2RD98_9ACTN|nr:MFS transporter [Actinomarinicola tropica]QGG94869.1 MFS transporter [Actinomarinicola tropica]